MEPNLSTCAVCPARAAGKKGAALKQKDPDGTKAPIGRQARPEPILLFAEGGSKKKLAAFLHKSNKRAGKGGRPERGK